MTWNWPEFDADQENLAQITRWSLNSTLMGIPFPRNRQPIPGPANQRGEVPPDVSSSGLHKARTGQVVAQTGREQEILPLPGIYFFDGGYTQRYQSPTTCHAHKRYQSKTSL